MKTKDILLLGGVALVAYLLLRRRKRPMMASDIKTTVSAPTPAPTVKAAFNDVLKKNPVVVEDIVVPIKKPIVVPATNLIPNIYDRGVGQPVDFDSSGERYYNMSGVCWESVSNACQCSLKDKQSFKLDIPTLP